MAGSRRKSRYFPILLLSLVAAAVYRIILTHLLGDRGVSYFSVPNELFFLTGGALSYGIRDSVSLMVGNRMAKEQYDGAKQVVRLAFLAGVALSIIAGILLYLISSRVAGGLFHMPLSVLSILSVLPAVPLAVFTGVLRGFFDGTGNSGVSALNSILFAVLYAIAGCLLSVYLRNYGYQVETILRSEEFSFSYGALGASLGILASTLICFLHMAVMYVIMDRRTVYKGFSPSSMRSNETGLSVFLGVIVNGLLPMGLFFVNVFLFFINEICYFRLGEDAALFTWGEYYGKVLPLAAILILLISLSAYPFLRRSYSAVRREEYRNAREGLGRMIHRLVGIGVFAAGMLAVLGPDLLDSVFSANSQNTAFLLQISAVSVAAAPFAILFTELIIRMRYVKLSLIISAISLGVHIVLIFVLTGKPALSLLGIIIGNAVYFALIAIVSSVFVSRAFQYTQEWVRTFAVTIVAALISSVFGMFIGRSLSPVAGKPVSCFVTVLISLVIYMIILLALKGYSEEELLQSPVGRVMASIGRAFHLL